MILLQLILMLLTIHEVLFWVYYWQLKEYRRDRLFDGLENDGLMVILKSFDLSKWYRPKMTIRASLVLGVMAGLVVAWSLASISQATVIMLLAPLWVTVVVAIWTPLFVYLRLKMVAKAALKMKSFKGQVIGITGSYGKSSTKEKIAWVLETKYKVVKTPKNINSLIGIAQTILTDLKGDEDFFVVEMGAYKLGEISEMCDLVKPKYGIVTAIGDQHLNLFGSLENIKKAKMELIEALPEDGFGLVAGKDFKYDEVKKVEQTIEGVEFEFESKEYWIAVKGKSKLQNVVGSIRLLRRLGMSDDEIGSAFKSMPEVYFHPKVVKLGGNYILDDSYNASLESVIAALDYLKAFKGYKKMVVTAGLMELGKRSKVDHRILAKKFDEIDRVIVTNNKNWHELEGSSNRQLVTHYDVLKKELVDWLGGEKRIVLFAGRTFTGLLNTLKKELNDRH